MILKNLFLTDLFENLKRRLWPLILFLIVTLFAYPIGLAMTLNNQISYHSDKTTLIRTAAHYMGMNELTMILASVCAAVSAIQGFSYLYHRNKVDMYQSQPVSSKRRFRVIYLNGILIYLIPYAAAILISMVVAHSMNISSGAFTAYAWWSVLAGFLVYLAVYNITILAVMMTGHLIVSCMAAGVFLGYEYILNYIISNYCSTYFISYASKGTHFFSRYYTSPLEKALELTKLDATIWNIKMTVADIGSALLVKSMPVLLFLAAQAIIAFVLAWICYRIRPMESSGKAMAFEKIKAPIKVLLVFLAGISASLILKHMSEGNNMFAVLGLLSGLILGQCIVEIIYEFDMRAVLKSKIPFVVASAAAVLFYLIFSMDLIGYDHYVPKADQLASSAVQIGFGNAYNYTNLNLKGFDKTDGNGWTDYNYDGLEHMQIKNSAAVLAMAKDGMGIDVTKDTKQDFVTCTVLYHMKDGKKIYRSFPIFFAKETDNLNRLFADMDYKNGSQQFADPVMKTFLKQAKPSYSDGFNENKILVKDAADIMESYQKDYNAMTFTQAASEVPCGIINLYYTQFGYQQSIAFPVFASYQNTVDYLKKENAYMDKKIDPESIASIQITDYSENAATSKKDSSEVPASENSSTVNNYPQVTYDKPEQIKEIAAYLRPVSLMNWSYLTSLYCSNLNIVVTGTNDAKGYAYNWSSNTTAFAENQIPQRVVSDLKYHSELVGPGKIYATKAMEKTGQK